MTERLPRQDERHPLDSAGQQPEREKRPEVDPLSPVLPDLLVVEVGDRVGVGACGSLLAQLGADVVLIEPATASSRHKWLSRASAAAGKRSVIEGRDGLAQLLDVADVLLLSSDLDPSRVVMPRPAQIVCDITAFGATGPWAGRASSDALVQAASGIADTTGDPHGAPTVIGFPLLEYAAGLYAAAAVLAALRVRRRSGRGQRIDIALFDCAVSALTTFLPFHYTGKSVTRGGNAHALAAPWNAYRANDGWILICTATDDQWQRLCHAIGRPELASAAGYATNTERVARRAEVDAAVQVWVAQNSVRECIERLGAIGIACGAINTIEQLAAEPNLRHRGMICDLTDHGTGKTVVLPGSPLKGTRTAGAAPQTIPRPGQDLEWLARVLRESTVREASNPSRKTFEPPCKGLTVVEIGQFTTAPLVTRQLAALGATVYKVEPPGGEGSRGWPPNQGNQGYFFTFSNSDKQSLMLDLKDADDRRLFSELLAKSDVLVENLKPGSLARLGFSMAQLAARYPRLIYCAISGFGADSAYPGRPAFDTVVQAMAGFMDLTRAGSEPQKAGISAADIVGGEFSLFAILAALEYRDRCGTGQALDISMQDAAVWVTQANWNGAPATEPVTAVRCRDGYLLLEGTASDFARCASGFDARLNAGIGAAEVLSRAELLQLAGKAGFSAAPVLTVSEVAESEQVRARRLLIESVGQDGRRWPLLNSPLRLALTPPRVEHPIGSLGEANAAVKAWLATNAPSGP